MYFAPKILAVKKIGVIVPYRGDRPRFFENLKRMLNAQTLQPTIIEFVDFPPAGENKDITVRYREGYERLRGKGLDVIALMEVDDWYAPDYLEVMYNEWEKEGRPDIFGQTYTIYYHIKEFGYFTMHHIEPARSSAMNTFIKPDLNLTWPPDFDPYTDVHLWKFADINQHQFIAPAHRLRGVVFTPKKHICLGIKHGVGLCGGGSHIHGLERYTYTRNGVEDKEKKFLRETMDAVSFEFYSNYFAAEVANNS